MRVTIDKLDHHGRGITKIDGVTTFVSDALPSEEIEIEIIKEKKKYNEAKLMNVISASSDRRDVLCPYYEFCGGCNIMHMNYEFQLKFKKDKIEDILLRYAGLNVEVSIEPSNEYHYRNKITVHNDGKTMGFKKEKSNEIIKIDKCLISDDKINGYLNSIRDFSGEEFVIRTNGKDVISSKDDKMLMMTVNDMKFRIDINSFFQVNSYICGKVFEYILENINKCNVALDLYSGVCTLGILISKKTNKVYSIEVNSYSYANAKENLKLNNVNNVVLMNGKVEDIIKKIEDKVDLIVCDPPRSGMDKFTIETILKMEPREVVYMSCDPITLARDLSLLKEKYNLVKIKAFDMFPNTYHVESVVLLSLKTIQN